MPGLEVASALFNWDWRAGRTSTKTRSLYLIDLDWMNFEDCSYSQCRNGITCLEVLPSLNVWRSHYVYKELSKEICTVYSISPLRSQAPIFQRKIINLVNLAINLLISSSLFPSCDVFFSSRMMSSADCGLVIVLLGRPVLYCQHCLYFTSHITWVMRQQATSPGQTCYNCIHCQSRTLLAPHWLWEQK